MKFKNLAIISDCIHVFDENGKPATENHIFKRQMEALANKFQQTLICCPFVPYSNNKIISVYSHPQIQFISLPNVGGATVLSKIQLIKIIPVWLKAFKKANKFADIIYQRFPNNINIPGFFYFYFKKAKTFATYTGTWKNYKTEPATYRFQKWLLKKIFRGPVFIYTMEKLRKENFFKSISPSYTLQEWEEETKSIENKINRLITHQKFIPTFITVGSLVANKNQQYILDAFKILHEEQFPFQLYIVGDGVLKNTYQQFIEKNQLTNQVFLIGKKTHIELRALYRKADFLVQAPLAEGFGKVPVEGFFHGVIPLLNNVGLAKEMTGNNERGFLFYANNKINLVQLIKQINAQKNLLPQMITNGRIFSRSQTLENWANDYAEIINRYFE
ncbi:MAG: glycosyltransferase [Chitinophagaceae bacterium]